MHIRFTDRGKVNAGECVFKLKLSAGPPTGNFQQIVIPPGE